MYSILLLVFLEFSVFSALIEKYQEKDVLKQSGALKLGTIFIVLNDNTRQKEEEYQSLSQIICMPLQYEQTSFFVVPILGSFF